MTINGTNFTGATAVQFGTVNATSYTVDSTGTVITAVSPAGSPGYVHITVTTPAGTSPQSPSGLDTFEYLAANTGAPSVTSIASPVNGPAAGGTTVTINGTNFTGATAVQFGTVNATSYTVDSTGTVITAVSPAGSPGYVHITVTTPAGTSPQSPSGLDTFEYLAANTGAPSVTSIASPVNGPAAGGTTVTINGTNFTGATAVQFGTVNATSYTVDSTGTVITAVSPAGSPGYVHITVTTPAGTSPQSPSGVDTFEYV